MIFIFLFNYLNAFGQTPTLNLIGSNSIQKGMTNASKERLGRLAIQKQTEASECLGVAILLELSSGPELDMVERGHAGAIVEELIKTIEQEIPIITSSILLDYLKLLMGKKVNVYKGLQNQLMKYSFFQTEQDNFILLIPQIMSSSKFSNNLREVNFSNFKNHLAFDIDIEELKSIFNMDTASADPITIYLSGHGAPITWNNKPSIANLKLDEYREFIKLLDQINCKFLFISSCYASGLNMVNVHTGLLHGFPIGIGNLTDSSSSFYPTISFKRYFFNLNRSFKSINNEIDFLYSNHFKKAIKKICGKSVSNTPWLKLPNSEKFSILNLNNNLMINHNTTEIQQLSHGKPAIVMNNSDCLLLCSVKIPITLKIAGPKLPDIISAIPGPSYHEFQYVKAKKQILYEFINCILKVPYEFTKVFFFKKAKIKKAKRKPNKFKVITVKNLLIINHGAQSLISANDFLRANEIYFQKGTHYHRLQVPVGIKLGYLEIESETFPLQNKKAIIDNFLQLSMPSDQVLKSIGEFP